MIIFMKEASPGGGVGKGGEGERRTEWRTDTAISRGRKKVPQVGGGGEIEPRLIKEEDRENRVFGRSETRSHSLKQIIYFHHMARGPITNGREKKKP